MAENIKRNRVDGEYFRALGEKPDIVKTALDSYLFHRNYPESKFNKRSISLEELTSNENVMAKVRKPNSILLNNSTFRNAFGNNSNILDIESSFGKLHSWVNNVGCDKLKGELLNIIPPLFCHLYLDLMHNGFQQSANSLLKYYQEQKNVTDNDVVSQVLKDLGSLDLKSKPIIKSFRSKKYVVTLTLEAANILKYFLANHGHLLIIQVFQNWFDVELLLLEHCSDADESEDEMAICNGDTGQEIDLDLRDLQDAIDAVNKLPPPMLNINVYNTQGK